MLKLGTRSSKYLRETGGPGKSPESPRVPVVAQNSGVRSHLELRVPVLTRGDTGNTEFRVTSGTRCCKFGVISVTRSSGWFREHGVPRDSGWRPGVASDSGDTRRWNLIRSNLKTRVPGVTRNYGFPQTPRTTCSWSHMEIKVPGVTRKSGCPAEVT